MCGKAIAKSSLKEKGACLKRFVKYSNAQVQERCANLAITNKTEVQTEVRENFSTLAHSYYTSLQNEFS